MRCEGCTYAVLLADMWCCDYLNVTGRSAPARLERHVPSAWRTKKTAAKGGSPINHVFTLGLGRGEAGGGVGRR